MTTDLPTGGDMSAVPGNVRADIEAALRILDHLPDLIRNERHRRGLTLAQACAEMDMVAPDLSRMENGLRRPNYRTIVRLLSWVEGSMQKDGRP